MKIQEAIDEKKFPPLYDSHPVVTQSAEPVLPVALYIDAVPYTLTDSVIGFWMINVLTGRRHLFLILRKRMVCKCGCRGWCTFYPIMVFVHWCLQAFAAGVVPCQLVDGSPVNASCQCQWLLNHAGSPLVVKAALTRIQGDWAEYCERMGCQNWKSSLRPCFCCNVYPEIMHTRIADISPVSLPHRLNLEEDFDAACKRCEIHITVTVYIQLEITPLLHYDKRQMGNLGRCLLKDCPHLGLLAGDRLEPCKNLPDVGIFGTLNADQLPRVITFWRHSEPLGDPLASQRAPLWAFLRP